MKLQPANDQKQKELEVLQLLRGGNKAAFEEIFRSYWKAMFNHAYSKLHSTEVAKEIVQDIFTALWEKREQLLITNLSYYLHGSVKNRVLNHIRALMRNQKYWERYQKYLPGSAEITEEAVLYDDLKESFDRGIYLLPEKAKTIFHLSRVEGYSVPEIASKLGISEKVVEYHLTSSIKKLRVHLKDYFQQ